ncbi:MAG: hypothetical protein EOP48_04755 [Sphingobacteriales bacterium]|nr:MAG: hypothetical protein EOP48_04755 [Sphingobacteriales bacterium]
MKTKSAAILLLFMTLLSCQNKAKQDDFYSSTKRWDLWRVPILKPFEIVSPTNDDAWFLIIKHPKLSHKDYFNPGDEYGFQLTSIDSVGVADSILIFKSRSYYWPKLSGDYQTTLIINAKTNEQFIFSDEHHQSEIRQKLKSLKADNTVLHSFNNVKNGFQAKGILPKGWRR